QMVLTGESIQRLSENRYDVEQGSYTNCNGDLIRDPSAAECSFAWKLYGRRLSITFEEYAHVHDALIYIKDVPVIYMPYFMVPIKTIRQSGLLMASFTYQSNLGNGFRLPFFWAIAPWQDMTITPTFYSSTGYHLGVNYRYIYSANRLGDFNFYLLQ